MLKRHEQALVSLMQVCIDRVKIGLFTKGIIANDDVTKEFIAVSSQMRMNDILMFVLTLMEKASEEECGKIFDRFLDVLDKELAWESLKDDLCKLMFHCKCHIIHKLTCIYVHYLPYAFLGGM